MLLQKGAYLSEKLEDWTTKTDYIKSIFEKLGKENLGDDTRPLIEVYKNMQEMYCMIPVDERKSYIYGFEKASEELIQHISSLDEEELNTIPFEGSWTAGQLAEHVIASNKGFVKLLNGPVKETERAPDKFIELIRENLMNFSIEMKSPEFVLPKKTSHHKSELMNDIENIQTSMHQVNQSSDLTQTCVLFEVPVLGFLTRKEVISFALFHTQRHIHQLKNIITKLKAVHTL